MTYVFKNFVAFLKLIRWTNLLFIILIQFALYYVLVDRMYKMAGIEVALGYYYLSLLALTTVMIAAAGYIINDYMDVETDKVNKPAKMILSNQLSMKAGMRAYRILNIVAVITGFYLSWKVGSWRLGMLFPMIMILLWLYSVKYKNSVLWGNVAIAVMSAFVVLFVWLFEFFMLRQNPEVFVPVSSYLKMITGYFLFYAFFAFLLTMLREIIKDAEDVQGDSVSGFNTLAVKLGIQMSRKIAAVICVITLLAVGAVVYMFFTGLMNVAAYYFIIAVAVPLIYILTRILKAQEQTDFHLLSNFIKIIMLAGLIGLQPIVMSLT